LQVGKRFFNMNYGMLESIDVNFGTTKLQ